MRPSMLEQPSRRVVVLAVFAVTALALAALVPPRARAEPLELELALSQSALPSIGAPSLSPSAIAALGVPILGARLVVGASGGWSRNDDGSRLVELAVPIEIAWRTARVARGRVVPEVRFVTGGSWLRASFGGQEIWQLRLSLGGLAGATWWASRQFGVGLIAGLVATRSVTDVDTRVPMRGTTIELASRLVVTMRLD